MDAPGLPPAEVADAYRTLGRVNRQLGNRAALRHELRRFLREDPRPPGPIRLLDVGSGSADLLRVLADDLARAGHAPLPVALDRDPVALALAADRGVIPLRADALHLPFPDRAFDLVTAVKFAHHFSGEPLARLLGEMARVAGRRVLVLDIRRHWLAYWGFVLWSRTLTRNRLVRYDGPLSVLRGFTPAELRELAGTASGFAWTVRRYPGFQLALVGRRLPD
jgi:ubiquinone/menaquinone biosynthesis C-methylase UbiE